MRERYILNGIICLIQCSISSKSKYSKPSALEIMTRKSNKHFGKDPRVQDPLSYGGTVAPKYTFLSRHP